MDILAEYIKILEILLFVSFRIFKPSFSPTPLLVFASSLLQQANLLHALNAKNLSDASEVPIVSRKLTLLGGFIGGGGEVPIFLLFLEIDSR